MIATVVLGPLAIFVITSRYGESVCKGTRGTGRREDRRRVRLTGQLCLWTPSETGTVTYVVPSGYVDYRDLSGGTTGVITGESIPITVEPIILEKATGDY